jgi:hypothetical protein
LLKRFPFHPWLIACYPALALLAHNVTQVGLVAALRALLASLALATLIFLLVWLISRHAGRAALYASLALVLFFSYGQTYRYLQIVSKNSAWVRHPILGAVYLGLLVLGIFGISRLRNTASATLTLNLTAIVLTALPLVVVLNFYRAEAVNARQVKAASLHEALHYSGPGQPPDVYFIMLDTYMRGDALQRDMHYDNSSFLDSLEDLGFYVAECSRPNYDYTRASLTSTLNMDYLPALRSQLEAHGNTNPRGLWALLLPNKTRRLLEALGYRTVALQTTYEWTEMRDADIYLAPGSNPLTETYLLPFETMLLRSTSAIIFMETHPERPEESSSSIEFPYNYHVETERYVLDTLPELAKMPGPKFVFVHILIPHTPYVFKPDGSIRVDPNYYGGKNMNSMSWNYQVEGYVDSVKFINSRMLPILNSIIQDSDVPPIIVMEGDHGLTGNNRTQNLSTYFLPGDGAEELYPSITPVNSFRLIFDHYFAADYYLLPDETYTGFNLDSDGRRVYETAPECLP